jgi:hypothetical protein
MVFVLLAWILLAPLGAWIVGSAVALADKRNSAAAAAQTDDELPCPEAAHAEPEYAAVGA